jgi:hypothetical protein
LLDRVYETDEAFDPRREKQGWERFAHYLDHLNETGGGKTVYKLLYTARHGQGHHNVKEREVGTAAWEVSFSSESLATYVPPQYLTSPSRSSSHTGPS